MPTISAIVPATNAPPTLGACLEAIRAAEEPPDEVIVIEDGGGPADARNRGAARARGEVLVFVDADVVVHANAFALIRRAFDDDPALAALFGSYDDRPADPGTVSVFRNLLHHHVHQEGAGPASTFWAGLGAVRRDRFEAVGGFDAARYAEPSVEDIDLGTRIAADGGSIRLDPSIQGTHLKAWTLRSMVETDFWNRGTPWVELLLRSGGSSTLNLGWRHRLSAIASLLAAAAVLRGRWSRALLALGALVALNRSFYELLARRQGRRRAAAGVALHALHHVVGALSVPVGIVQHLRSRDH
ncbi:MAG TPA: glycosyltransferase family A protein [Gaiellaceae bacterium]|nr:glycosyltransferase family A protein [Gaiellaceae bacterium]